MLFDDVLTLLVVGAGPRLWLIWTAFGDFCTDGYGCSALSSGREWLRGGLMKGASQHCVKRDPFSFRQPFSMPALSVLSTHSPCSLSSWMIVSEDLCVLPVTNFTFLPIRRETSLALSDLRAAACLPCPASSFALARFSSHVWRSSEAVFLSSFSASLTSVIFSWASGSVAFAMLLRLAFFSLRWTVLALTCSPVRKLMREVNANNSSRFSLQAGVHSVCPFGNCQHCFSAACTP